MTLAASNGQELQSIRCFCHHDVWSSTNSKIRLSGSSSKSYIIIVDKKNYSSNKVLVVESYEGS